MNNRIKRFMDHKGISPSELADTIGVQRSNVTHVLHGRNMPSFQFISKMLEQFPEINAKWLIMGSGNMLEDGETEQQELFAKSPEPVVPPKETPVPEPLEVPFAFQDNTSNEKDAHVSPERKTREIERIVVFYSDQTFKEYGPAK